MPVSSSALMPSLSHTGWVTAGSRTPAGLLRLQLQPQHCHASSWTRTGKSRAASLDSPHGGSPSPTLTAGCQNSWHPKNKDSATAGASSRQRASLCALSPPREMQEDFVCRTMNDVEMIPDTNQKADTILPPVGSHSNANNYWTHLPIVQGLGPVQGSITQKSWHALTPCPEPVT